LKVVLDSNVLFRTLISTGNILEVIFNPKLQIFSPKKLIEEFNNNKDEILFKSKLSESEFNILLKLLLTNITFIELSEYKEFIPEAKQLLKEHLKDVEFMALALKLNCSVWTYEELFFRIGFGISTKKLSESLKSSTLI